MLSTIPLVALLFVSQSVPPRAALGQSPSAADLAAIRQELAALRAQQEAMGKDVDTIKTLLLAALGGRQDGPAPDATVEIAGRPAKGSPDAKVILVEFTDYQCPYCERYFNGSYSQIIRDYVDTGKIRYVVKNLPIEQIHPQAFRAAVAALCAGDQGRYWEMHDRLFANQKQLAPEQIEAQASALQLDMPRFRSCASGDTHEAMIREDLEEAMNAGVNGTPMFILGLAAPGARTVTASKVIVGAQPYSVFKTELDALLARAK